MAIYKLLSLVPIVNKWPFFHFRKTLEQLWISETIFYSSDQTSEHNTHHIWYLFCKLRNKFWCWIVRRYLEFLWHLSDALLMKKRQHTSIVQVFLSIFQFRKWLLTNHWLLRLRKNLKVLYVYSLLFPQ